MSMGIGDADENLSVASPRALFALPYWAMNGPGGLEKQPGAAGMLPPAITPTGCGNLLFRDPSSPRGQNPERHDRPFNDYGR
jgi:hypothetical protein